MQWSKYSVPAPNVTIEVTGGYRTVTDKDGYYFLATNSEGTFYGTMSGVGYLTSNFVATVANGKIKTGVNETIMRAAASNELKIMLPWNDVERDVDSHTATKNFHVYYADREYIGSDGYQYVDLDWDDIEYYGPETTTICKLEDGEYLFFVHNFSKGYPLSDSESKVEVFLGNSNVPNYPFKVPANTGDNLYWAVFKLHVSNNGTNVQLEEINKLYRNGLELFSEQLGINNPNEHYDDYYYGDDYYNY